MANVPMHFSATIEDGFKAKTSTDVYLELPEATTLTEVAAALGTWLTALDGISAGAIVGSKVAIAPAPPGGIKSLTGGSVAASRIAQNGLFRFSASGVSPDWSSNVPALNNTMIVNGAPDPTGTATYTGLLTSGVYANPTSDILLTLTRSKVTTRKHRKSGA